MNAPADFSSPQRHERATAALHHGSSTPEPLSSRPVSSTHPSKPPRVGLLIFVVLILLVAGGIAGLLPRLRERRMAVQDMKELAQPNVAVVSPAPAQAGAPLVLSGELRPIAEAAIHARVGGYVRRWLVDLGAKVEAGQLLAELDTPETDRELSQARAQLAQAEAARDLAATTAKRWKEMLSAKTVSAQETDEKNSDLALKKATVESARANVERLEEIAKFARITAPFAGTITARSIDVGQLVNPADGRELFRLMQTDKLRVFVRVPQNYARSAAPGQAAEITLPELPGQKFTANIVRTAGALDAATRTLLTELEVDNSNGEILAGSYAQVRLPEAKPVVNLAIPANTILFRAEGSQIALVEGGKIAFRTITLGRDLGSAVEVLSGVTTADKIVVNPSDALTEGVAVHTVEAK